jgi:hypothetical protein
LRKHMATIQNGVLLGPIFQSFQQRWLHVSRQEVTMNYL